MVVFNTVSDITITMKANGDAPFIPILVAPFSTVTIDSASQGSYGMIVAKNLVGNSSVWRFVQRFDSLSKVGIVHKAAYTVILLVLLHL
jgi:hypothetical protein